MPRPPQQYDEFELREQIKESQARIDRLTQEMAELRESDGSAKRYARLQILLDVEKANIEHCEKKIAMLPKYFRD